MTSTTDRLRPRGRRSRRAVAAALVASGAASLCPSAAVVANAAPAPRTAAASSPTLTPAASSGCNLKLAGTTTRTAPGSGKTVALTFDDSSATDMTSVLKILRRYGVRATFFNIGSEDAKMPAVVTAAAVDGHLVAPHTWSHEYPSKANGNWSVPYLTDETVRTAAQQQRLTGRRPCFFRPPGGNMNNVSTVTRHLGMQNVLWSVDSRDWSEQRVRTKAATAGIVKRATDLRYAVSKNHPIVLMHAGKQSPEPRGHTFSDRPNTVAALPAIIEWYRARGYRFVAMDGSSGLNPVAVTRPVAGAASGHGFTADARPDLLTVSVNGDLNLFAGNGRGYVTGPTRIGVGWNSYTGIWATDFTGDRRTDVLARTAQGELRLYRGNGNGQFSGSWSRIGAGWNIYDLLLAPGDVTGDGKPDLFGRTKAGQLNLYRGNGGGGFASGATKVGSGWQRYTQLLTPGDFNGDGRADLIGRTSDGQLHLLRGNGNGTFAAPARIGSGWNMFTRIFSPGDLNGDSRPDVVGLNRAGQFHFYAGAGTGLRPAASYRPGGWTMPLVSAAR